LPLPEPKVWREMTEEERLLAFGFCYFPTLLQCDALARAMVRKAQTNGVITEKQAKAIRAIARTYGVTINHGRDVLRYADEQAQA
jgi:sulfite reductase beta subunit-like hemoprotein